MIDAIVVVADHTCHIYLDVWDRNFAHFVLPENGVRVESTHHLMMLLTSMTEPETEANRYAIHVNPGPQSFLITGIVAEIRGYVQGLMRARGAKPMVSDVLVDAKGLR